MSKYWPLAIPVIVLIAAVLSQTVLRCDKPLVPVPPTPYTLAEAIVEPQGAVDIPFGTLPNMNVDEALARLLIEPYDADSVELTPIRGGNYYHPVNLAHRSFQFIAVFHKTGDTSLLVRAERTARAMMAQAQYQDSAAFLPYPFSHSIHGNKRYPLPAPWYSGMAQGEWLSVMVRLYRLTGNEQYRIWSDELFRSLQHLAGQDRLWTCRIDSSRYFWIEEYPNSLGPDQTLNGFIAAVYGLHEYVLLTDSDDAWFLYNAAVTTLKHYLPDYRRPGATSYYCLGHLHVADETYHSLHIRMMEHLLRTTGDSAFYQFSLDFKQDFPIR